MPGRQGVPLSSVRTWAGYVTWTVLSLGRAARLVWLWCLHPRDMVADLRRVRQKTLLWDWLVGADSTDSNAEKLKS